jgi:serine/threonine protein kinase
MGEVYRARDTRLRREVAIKVLPQHVMSDPSKRQRFEREAQAIAALNHPNICALFDVGSQDDTEFLVMEYLEGDTLEKRLVRGHLPLEQAVRYAIEIAGALDHAHRHGIVHRDLKPTNIVLTEAGAKLLDFGLAKWSEREPVLWGPGAAGDLPETQSLTSEGTILGTLQYMSPEQVEGKDADARADLFSFGAIAYEMVTGRRAFNGGSHAGLIAAILTSEPVPMTTLEPLVPPALDRIVKKCLAKDPDVRWQSARDLLDGLKWAAESASLGVVPADSARQSSRDVRAKRRTRIAWLTTAVVAAIAAVTTLALVFMPSARVSTDQRTVRFIVSAPEGTTFDESSAFIAVSPDGRSLAFNATSSSTGEGALWVRSLESPAARQILGTDGARQPFWSPDSRFIGLLSAGQALRKIDSQGGPAQTLVDAPGAYTATWNREGTVVFMLAPNRGSGLYQIPASGGAAVPVTTLDQTRGETAHAWPQFLPDGRHFLYTAHSRQTEHHGVVYVGSLDSGDRVRLFKADSRAEYAWPGFLLYVQGSAFVSDLILGGTLVAHPFDAAKLRVTGDPVRIVGRVDLSRDFSRGAFSLSQTGVLAYRPVAEAQLDWHDRSGRRLQSIGAAANSALSPDGKRLAVARVNPDTGASNIWLMDVAGGTAAQFTFGTVLDDMPLWSPDGSRIVFRSDRGQGTAMYQKASSGGAEEMLLTPEGGSPESSLQPLAWSGDGLSLVYGKSSPTTNLDLWILPLSGDRRPVPLFQEEFSEWEGQTSPDGRWIAYVSTETGQSEVYVRPFPSGGGKWKISAAGGTQPAWRRDGKEVFYLAQDGRLMAVDVRAGSTFDPGRPSALFQTRMSPLLNRPGSRRNQYLVTADGQRFLIHQPPEGRPSSLPITVVVNWAAALTP